MKLQSLSKHSSDDSLFPQTALLSTFSDNNGGLRFVFAASALHHPALCLIMLCLCLFAFKEKRFLCCWNRILDFEFKPLDHGTATFLFCLTVLLISTLSFFFIIHISTILLTATSSFSSSPSFPWTFSCFLSPSGSPSLCPPNWPRCFVSALFPLTGSWCDCFVFSVRGQCVYLAQILDLFITMADLGSAQANSPQAWVLTGPLRLPLFIDSEQAEARMVPPATVTHSLYRALCKPERLDSCSSLKAMERFIIISMQTCAYTLQEPNVDTHMHKRPCTVWTNAIT